MIKRRGSADRQEDGEHNKQATSNGTNHHEVKPIDRRDGEHDKRAT